MVFQGTALTHRDVDLSVVIPAYNAGATLADQLAAVCASLPPGAEVIVVDNRSTDGTRLVAEHWARCDERVRVVHADEVAGESAARNVGVREARSERIAFCDADDVVGPTWATAMNEALARWPYVTGPVELDRLNPSWLSGVRGQAIFSSMPRTVNDIPFAHGCNLGLRRELALDLGFDEGVVIGTDVDFAVRAHLRGIELQWVPGAVVHYRHRARTGERVRQAYAYGRAAARPRALLVVSWSLADRLRAQGRRSAWLLRSVPRLGDRGVRARWLWTLALVAGEVRG